MLYKVGQDALDLLCGEEPSGAGVPSGAPVQGLVRCCGELILVGVFLPGIAHVGESESGELLGCVPDRGVHRDHVEGNDDLAALGKRRSVRERDGRLDKSSERDYWGEKC